MAPLAFVILPVLVLVLAAAVWQGWRGALVASLAPLGMLAVLLVMTLWPRLFGHPPTTPSARFQEGQRVVLLEAFGVFALALGALPGGLAGLAIRHLALRRRAPVLEVEPSIQERGSKR